MKIEKNKKGRDGDAEMVAMGGKGEKRRRRRRDGKEASPLAAVVANNPSPPSLLATAIFLHHHHFLLLPLSLSHKKMRRLCFSRLLGKEGLENRKWLRLVRLSRLPLLALFFFLFYFRLAIFVLLPLLLLIFLLFFRGFHGENPSIWPFIKKGPHTLGHTSGVHHTPLGFLFSSMRGDLLDRSNASIALRDFLKT